MDNFTHALGNSVRIVNSYITDSKLCIRNEQSTLSYETLVIELPVHACMERVDLYPTSQICKALYSMTSK